MSTVLEPQSRISPEVKGIADEVVELRRDFHRHPELMFDLPYTTGKVAAYLKALGLEVKTGLGQSGVVGLLKGGKPGDTVVYRADMDALPLLEETGYPYASETKGVMHACGHDFHTAVGLGMAKLLVQEKDRLPGSVAFLFQPAEEGGDGAGAMIADGVLDWLKPKTCFAMHINNDEPVGKIGARVGGVFAGSNEFTIKLKSKGGHGASPHQAPDLIVIASHIVIALQTVVSRSVDPRESAVVTVGLLHAGTKSNILPTEALLEGTVRTFDKELTLQIAKRIETLARAIAGAHDAGIEYHFEMNYPPTINAPEPTALVREVAGEVVGPSNVTDYWTTGSEDMSRFLDLVPGCYYVVGAGQADPEATFAHHSGRFNPDERCLPIAVEMGVRVVRKALGA
ncbi:MAG: M20 metallopeptidase family protein [Candidatus Eiseniibacteriota bacterium]